MGTEGPVDHSGRQTNQKAEIVSGDGEDSRGSVPVIWKVHALLKTDRNTDSETTGKLVKAYAKKIELLSELQAGIRIYSYDYLKKHNIRLAGRA